MCIDVPLLVALLHRDEVDASADYRHYNFDMTVLADHLRRQIDLNKNASYFNIDILKYQVMIYSNICMLCVFSRQFSFSFNFSLFDKKYRILISFLVAVVGVSFNQVDEKPVFVFLSLLSSF